MTKTSRIIINISDGINDEVAIAKVGRVIDGGKISASGRSYCYATVFDNVEVVTDKPNKNNTYTFYVYRRDEGQHDRPIK